MATKSIGVETTPIIYAY